MIDELKKALGPKKAIDPMEKQAKLSALKGMKKAAGDVISSGYDDMNKVTVAAPDKAGLEKGLEKAEDLLDGAPGGDSDLMMSDDDNGMEEMVEACDTPEKIDEAMKKLMEKKLELENQGE